MNRDSQVQRVLAPNPLTDPITDLATIGASHQLENTMEPHQLAATPGRSYPIMLNGSEPGGTQDGAGGG